MNTCRQCGKEIPEGKKFCNNSCSAKYSNKHRGRKPWSEERRARYRVLHPSKSCSERFCKHCGRLLNSSKGEHSTCLECRKYLKLSLYGKLGFVDGSLKSRYDRSVQLLKELYFEKKLSSLEIWERTGVNFRTLRDLFRENGLHTRDLSESNRVALLKGVRRPTSSIQYLHGWHKTWEGMDVYYRSSYELKFAQELDSKKVPYRVEEVRLPYYDTQTQSTRVAVVDFYLPNTNELVEIKSKYTLNIQNMKDKFKAYREAGYIPKLIVNGEEVNISGS